MALNLFEKALKKDPKNNEIYLELGKVFGNTGEVDRAIEIWQLGIKVDPQDGRFKDLIRQAQELKN